MWELTPCRPFAAALCGIVPGLLVLLFGSATREATPRTGRVVLVSYLHHIVQRGHNRQVVFAVEGGLLPIRRTVLGRVAECGWARWRKAGWIRIPVTWR
ncbi:hypothetical protein CAI21_16470 [Alkalilimnicola ehrlichii]|uniref:Uncharacterized protein n=1 Tax=Alkalilimnicola ehrlichii TaxID=351052 RepID=A0A3E0WLW7_9GAMM|nr:hypothetical protein CAI21_16470 [Alkalilimnicola ehrlichii]RFA32935.1 hypothetical protein CAL65_18525 [Alkalilimnicola ehrlichii]